MKISLRHQIILLACVFTLCSCEEIKDKITVDVDLGSFNIELDDIEVGDDDAKSAIVKFAEDVELTSFSATQIISMAMLNLSTDIEEYQSRIDKVVIGSAAITVVSTDDNGTVVQDFRMVATGTGIKELSVAEYLLGDAYSEGVDDFFSKLLMKLFTGSEVSLSVSGKTDVVSGEKLQVTITLTDVVIKAKVLTE